MLIDTHTHIPDTAGVDRIILAAADPAEIDAVFAAAQNNPDIFCAIGIHPEFFDAVPDYARMLDNPKVVAVGEIGLDYFYGAEHRERQVELFRAQVEIARGANLPVMVHSRGADADAADILKNVRGTIHCFTSGYDYARVMLDRGFYFGANGIITFKNADAVRETFAKIPIDRILSETDAPYCAPVPYRGRDCANAMVVEVVKCLAEIKKTPAVEMEKILWDNARKCYAKL